jgi:1-phosphatidylinositol phosphodiesterase
MIRPRSMRLITRSLIAAAATAAFLVIATPGTWAHETQAYRINEVERTDWMKDLPNVPLSELSIPGTHDSGASGEDFVLFLVRDIVLTQVMSISEQLNTGIRMFDIRLGRNSDNCPGPAIWIFHGSFCQGFLFTNDVLEAMKKFLAEHPSEAILMRMKHEQDDGGPLEEDLLAVLELYSEPDSKGFYKGLYKGGKSNPMLDDIRGKIVILQDINANLSSVTTPLNWADESTQKIQDDYNLATNWHLADKWLDSVVPQFMDADKPENKSIIYINFLSASGGGFPYFFASGHIGSAPDAPRLWTLFVRGPLEDTCSREDRCLHEYPSIDCGTVPPFFHPDDCPVYFEGLNILAMKYINSSIQGRTGIVMADFPGDGLIQSIIDVNFKRPTITAAATTQPNSYGWYKDPVVVHFTCANLPDGTSCPPDQTLSGDGDSISSTAQTIGWTTSNVVTVKIDTNPPTISYLAQVVVDATMPTGATVEFNVLATDATSGVLSSSCSPASNSVFAIGTTTVQCNAQDFAGNTSSVKFTVHVKSAAEQVADLEAQVNGIGPGRSLAAKVAAIKAAIDANKTHPACQVLNALANEVTAQTGKTLTPSQAASLLTDVRNLAGTLGC